MTHIGLKKFPLFLVINSIIIENNNEILKEKTFLDTPGYDSLEGKDRKKTIEAIKESDAILWIMDINDGTLKADAIKFIKECIKKELYIIINKADTKSPNDRKLTIEKVKGELRKNNVNFKDCILYSTKEQSAEYFKTLQNIIYDIKYEAKADFEKDVNSYLENIYEWLSKQQVRLKKLNSAFSKLDIDTNPYKSLFIYYDNIKKELQQIEENFKNLKEV